MIAGMCCECDEYHGPTVARCPYEDPSYYEGGDDRGYEPRGVFFYDDDDGDE